MIHLFLLIRTLAAGPPEAVPFEGVLSMPSRLKDGTVISMHADGRPFSEIAKDGPEQAAWLRQSTDHARTWSAPRRVFTYPAGKGCITHQIYTLVDRDDAIHAFAVRYFALPKKEDKSQGHSELFHNVSRDRGKTWSQPHRVNFGHGYTGAMNSFIQLKSGRILGALSYASANFVDAVNQIEFRSVTFYSDDGGESWHAGQDNIRVPFGPQVAHPGAIEPVMVELRDGRVWILIRTQTLRFYEAFSSDGGKSWTEPRPSRFMAPDSPGAIRRLDDGRLLFVWNDLASYPGGVTGHWRQYLYAAISADDGKNWSPSKFAGPVIEPHRTGSRGDYPFLCQTADGKVLLYYTRFGLREGASYLRQHNELVRLDPDWIAAR